jgi:hypothetical protein
MINIFNEVLKSKLDQSKKFCPSKKKSTTKKLRSSKILKFIFDQFVAIAYKMEHKDEPGVEIDLENATLNHFRTYDFFFYRLNSNAQFKS